METTSSNPPQRADESSVFVIAYLGLTVSLMIGAFLVGVIFGTVVF